MLSWFAARGSGAVALRALPVVLVLIQAQSALSFEGSLTILPSEPASTLDAHVPPQNLDLQKTVLDIVDSKILSQKQPLRFTKPTSQASKPETPKQAVTPTQQPAVSLSPKSKPSPFRKWVKPQSSGKSTATPKTDELKTDEPITAAPTTIAPKTSAEKTSTPKTNTPEVARRLGRSSRSAVAKPLPKPNRRSSTAVASDRLEPRTAKSPAAEPAVPQPTEYPVPHVDPQPSMGSPEELPPLTRSQLNLRKKVRSVLTHYYNRPLNTRDRSPWELMHAMLAFEAHSKVLQGGPRGEPITAVGWLCYNRACKRRTLMYVDDDGELRVRVGPALQGHRGQLLSMLAQSRINENYPMLVEGHELTIKDLIEMEKRTCYPRTELTFKLIGLMHYLDSDATWLNEQGMEWNIPRLIAEELRQPVRGAACGGTHRLSGLTLAYKTREKRGEPVDGQYLKAKKFVTRYQQYAYRLQNRDGSFSTEWFRGPGNEDSIDRKLKTTGHLLEWLLYAATEKELTHWRTTKAVNYLANIMHRNRYKDWESGPLGHAIHALVVYDRLMFSKYDQPGESSIATRAPVSTPSRRKR